ncbi:hypothetical protein [Oceanobacillus sp. FSL W7-1293]
MPWLIAGALYFKIRMFIKIAENSCYGKNTPLKFALFLWKKTNKT